MNKVQYNTCRNLATISDNFVMVEVVRLTEGNSNELIIPAICAICCCQHTLLLSFYWHFCTSYFFTTSDNSVGL